VAFLLAAWHSAVWLRKRNLESDDAAAAAARLGFLFCVLATVTGSIFAKVDVELLLELDPRETSIALLLLVYGAYLGSGGDRGSRAAGDPLGAYALVAFATVPFLMFAVPRMYASLHPDTVINARGKVEMSRDIRTVFFASSLAFLALFAWLYRLDCKVSRRLREVRP